MEKFRLLHTALYSKGWYKRDSKTTIWEDLKKTMEMDGYNGDYMNKHDIVYVLLNNCQRIPNCRAFELVEFVSGISKENCWKFGYYCKGNYIPLRKEEELIEYDYYEAIVRYCLSNISCRSKEELGIDSFPKPDYVNCLPRKNGVSDKKIEEMFN